MMNFLRKIRRSLIISSSIRKYLLYALGEVALVVLGILIALQINTWNNERILRQKEKLYLLEIRNNLVDDLEKTKVILEFNSHKDSIIESCLREILTNKSNLEVGQLLSSQMNVLSEFRVFTQNKVAFINMLSAENIDIISNDSLRTLLSTYYQEQNLDDGTQERLKQSTRIFVDDITPMLMTKENIKIFFNLESHFPSASQINYTSDKNLFGKLFGIQRTMAAHSVFIDHFQDKIEQLVKQIDHYLDSI